MFRKFSGSLYWNFRALLSGRYFSVRGKLIRHEPALFSTANVRSFVRRRYERAEHESLDWLVSRGHIHPTDRVLEGGGGLGTITMRLADIVGDSNIVVFEPSPRTVEALRANLALNGHSILVEEAALISANNDRVAFHDSAEFLGSSLYEQRDGSPVAVPARQFSQALSQVNPSIVVLDVEGAEADLLLSVAEWRQVRLIHVEIHPTVTGLENIKLMNSHLQKHGFEEIADGRFGGDLKVFHRA